MTTSEQIDVRLLEPEASDDAALVGQLADLINRVYAVADDASEFGILVADPFSQTSMSHGVASSGARWGPLSDR